MRSYNDLPRKLSPDEIDQAKDVLRDEDGNFYDISEDYYKQELKRRYPSIDSEIELQLAKELLNSNLHKLTQKQKEVVYLMMAGWPEKVIAKRLKINQKMVSQHLQAARKKLSKLITNTKDILKEGLQNGTKDTDTSNS